MLKTRVFIPTDKNNVYRELDSYSVQEQEDIRLQLQIQFLNSIGAKNIQVKEKWFMEKERREATLNVLANMMEKPVMTVLAEARMAGAILNKSTPKKNIYIDLDKYEAYLDKLINEEMKVVNNYQ